MQHFFEGGSLFIEEMSPEQRTTANELSEIIAENFGANATYVEALLARFRSDPLLVDESWRAYFEELLGNGQPAQPVGEELSPPPSEIKTSGDGATLAAATRPALAPAKLAQTKPAEARSEKVEPIRGAALKIVENMEASLAVPTATSQRRIPVKLLDENRRIINRHLQGANRGKASYTHLIAWAILRGLAEFPRLNDGFEVIDEQPSRVHRES